MSVRPPGRGEIRSIRGPRTIHTSGGTSIGSLQTVSQSGPVGQVVSSAQNAQGGCPTSAGFGMSSGDRSSVEFVGQSSKFRSEPRAISSGSRELGVFDHRPVEAILEELVLLESQSSVLRHRYGAVIRDITDLYLTSMLCSMIEGSFNANFY